MMTNRNPLPSPALAAVAVFMLTGPHIAGATAHKANEEPQVKVEPTASDTAPATLAIRPNKRYVQLNAAEKQSLRAMYKGLPDSDEPPFPADGYQPIIDQLLKIQQATGVTGRIFATVKVDEKGNGKSVSFWEIPDARLSEAISFVLVKKTRYKPAICNGKPCSMDFPILFDLGRS